jgi:hypothetical protein
MSYLTRRPFEMGIGSKAIAVGRRHDAVSMTDDDPEATA